MDTVNTYRAVNESFKKKLAFRIGIDAGFFSEYNNMILAMVYCLMHRIRFSLYSEHAWFNEKGWTEFFMPFCPEEKSRLNLKLNAQRELPPPDAKRTRLLTAYAKIRYGIDLFTWELWKEFRDRELEQTFFDVPELGIHGDLREACRVINDMVWRYNQETQSEVNQLIESIHLPETYLGFHIRGGDKFKEDDLQPISSYFDEMSRHSACRDAFILTDDYRIIQTIGKEYPEWTLYTLCTEEEHGYYHQQFMQESPDFIRQQTLRLFASTDILRRSEFFIGTFTSNPGMYLGMLMDRDRCLGVGGSNWRIW